MAAYPDAVEERFARHRFRAAWKIYGLGSWTQQPELRSAPVCLAPRCGLRRPPDRKPIAIARPEAEPTPRSRCGASRSRTFSKKLANPIHAIPSIRVQQFGASISLSHSPGDGKRDHGSALVYGGYRLAIAEMPPPPSRVGLQENAKGEAVDVNQAVLPDSSRTLIIRRNLG